jgi:hypothetical protein
LTEVNGKSGRQAYDETDDSMPLPGGCSMESIKSVLAACFLAVFAYSASASELSTQESADRGVTVAVTPLNVSASAEAWEFKVTLDTHSQKLTDDLTKSAVLLDGTGARIAAIGWLAGQAGGHHREGVLRFKALTAQPKSIELQIQRSGEPEPRSFRWQLN